MTTHVGLAPYVPAIAARWDDASPGRRWNSVEGSLVLVDISGFTTLSERLAERGRIGAEELTSVLNRVFAEMLEVALARGGTLLKFGGDALLLLFEGEHHSIQACAAAVEMRTTLRKASQVPTSVGRIPLRMSTGIHAGAIDFFLVGDSHRELLVTGPIASTTTQLEAAADAGEVVVSETIRERIPSSFVGEPKGSGWLLRKRKIDLEPCGPVGQFQVLDDVPESLIPSGLRAQLSSGLDGTEHRIATVGFVKFQGIDRMLAEQGPESVGDRLHLLVTSVQDAIDTEDATFLASDIDADGGKLILATGIPLTRHDDEGRLLRAARSIVDSAAGLDVRIGVHRGHVFSGNVGTSFRRTYTVMGDTVNMAARLMSVANEGDIYATPAVLNLSSTLFRTTALKPLHLKGKALPMNAFAVGEETGVRPPVLSDDLPFRGREAELEMLVGIINTCSRVGRGGMMTISGDTGVGKSRLIGEVLERCSGMETLIIQAEPSGVDNPYWAFRDPLRRKLGIERGDQQTMAHAMVTAVESGFPDVSWALPLLGDVMHIDIEDNETTSAIDPQFRPDRTADALIELLSAGGTLPIAIVAEDGQWLDKSSLGLIQKVGEAAESRPWTVLVTARSEDAAFEPAGEEIRLGPLDDDSIRSIAKEMTQATPLRPQEIEAIVSRADGNPLFLGEILRMISDRGNADELPETLDAVIKTEMDTLSPLPRNLLRYVSVLGRRFRKVILEDFLDPEEVRLDEATQRDLGRFIDEEGEYLSFRHSVLHDVAYESLSFSKRRELHARAGSVIEARAGDSPESVAEYLATHYSRSGEYEKAWRFARIAGDKARDAYANTEAAHHYELALDAARHVEGSDREKLSVLTSLGEAYFESGRYQSASRAFRRARRLVDDPVEVARLNLKQAKIADTRGAFSYGLRLATVSRRLLATSGDNEAASLLAEFSVWRGAMRYAQGRYDDAMTELTLAISEAQTAGDRSALAQAYYLHDMARAWSGQAGDSEFSQRAIAIYEELEDLTGLALVYNNLGAAAYFDGDWEKAVALYEKSREARLRSGNPVEAARADANLGEVLCDRGDIVEAEMVLGEARRIFKSVEDQWMTAFVTGLLGRVASRASRFDEAETLLREALQRFENLGAKYDVVDMRTRLVENMTLQGAGPSALDDVEEAIALANSFGAAGHMTRLKLLKGYLLAQSDQIEEALSLIEESLADSRERGAPYEVALGLEARVRIRALLQDLAWDEDLEEVWRIQETLGIVSIPRVPLSSRVSS